LRSFHGAGHLSAFQNDLIAGCKKRLPNLPLSGQFKQNAGGFDAVFHYET
jgi:hypothetical protein